MSGMYDIHTHQACHTLNTFGMLCIDVYDSVFKFLPISSNFAQPLRGVGQHSTGYNQQPDQLSTLYEGYVSRYMRQMVITSDTDWFSLLKNTCYLNEKNLYK